MKKSTWKKQHKWWGLVLTFFLLMFCVSGLVLNHPALFSSVNVSRGMLPGSYEYRQWNNGLMRGTVKWQGQVLMYGNGGVWITDGTGAAFADFNTGLPEGNDARNIRRMVVMPSGLLFALGPYGVYRFRMGTGWEELPLERAGGERLSDMASQGDTLVVTGRSRVYLSQPPYDRFTALELQSPDDFDGKVSLFRTVWLLHSGELFGLVGQLIVDGIALVLIFLCLSGLLYWFMPRASKQVHTLLMRKLFAWHNSVGRITILFTLFVCITGWFLRPPALIAIARAKVPPLPFSAMDSPNPWNDKLRTLRYDEACQDWLLYTSEGFYSLHRLDSRPRKVSVQPPVSVMGLNVEEKDLSGNWLLGSFSGMYVWNRQTGMVADYFTSLPPVQTRGIPIGAHAVSGYSADFTVPGFVVDYYAGTDAVKMPEWMASLPMSLRALCLEIHTGRIYTFLGMGTVFYIFVIGLAILWCLWSGWKISVRRKK
jgi:hypothetical protein